MITNNFGLFVVGTGRPANNRKWGQATEGSGFWINGPWSIVNDNVANSIYVVGDDAVPYVARPRKTIWGFGFSYFFEHYNPSKFIKWVPTKAKASYRAADWEQRHVCLQGLIADRNEVYGATVGGMTTWHLGLCPASRDYAAMGGVGSPLNIFAGFRAWSISTRGIYGYPAHRVVFHDFKMRNSRVLGTGYGGE
jgi:hypothetical protein